MNRAAALWAMAAMLLLGVVLGLGLARFADGTRAARGREGRPLSGWLARRLDLSEAQRESLAAVVARHRAALAGERRDYVARIWPSRDSLRADIRALLTPEQRERFDRMSRRMDRRTERWRHGRGDPD